jgi:hypothetical protein
LTFGFVVLILEGALMGTCKGRMKGLIAHLKDREMIVH